MAADVSVVRAIQVMRTRPYILLLTLIFAAWLGTLLPWTAWPGGAAFSSNVPDLSEWMSLIPSVRYGAQPMLIPGLLRIIPGFVAVLLAATVSESRMAPFGRWLGRTCALLIIFGMLPPFDFFRGQFNDPNYRQQAILSTLSLIGVVTLSIRPVQWIGVLCAMLGTLCALIGYALSISEFAALKLSVGLGVGLPVTVVALVVFAVVSLRTAVPRTS